MIADRLLTLLGPDIVKQGAESDPRFHRDWTARNAVVPQAVVLPRSTEDVSATLGLCDRLGVPVVPQGGLTGLVGGAMPTCDCVVINLSRLSPPPLIDAGVRTATVGAGITLQTLQDAAAAHDLTFPVDFGARGSCQLGGMIATNAGGVHVLHYGMMRAQVLGLEVVLADGTIVSSMNPLVKNNTGYDLRQVFIGSEGTLGIITRATLRLVPNEPARAVALLRVANVRAAHDLLAQLTSQGPALNAFEAMWPSYYAFACDVTGTAPLPQGDGITLLVETSGHEASPLQEALLAALEPAIESGLIQDAVLAQSEAQAQQFWDLREANEALPTRFGFLLGFDVSLPAVAMQDFVQRCEAGIAATIPPAQSLCFGHLGDGNLHLAITGAKPEDAGRIKDFVLGIVGQLSGSISAEHGVGTDKLAYLGLTRSAAEIDVMRRIKRALDPNGILNPGKLLPLEGPAHKATSSRPQERALS
jgi:D-lactate dehydrogenase (cytochrome)